MALCHSNLQQVVLVTALVCLPLTLGRRPLLMAPRSRLAGLLSKHQSQARKLAAAAVRLYQNGCRICRAFQRHNRGPNQNSPLSHTCQQSHVLARPQMHNAQIKLIMFKIACEICCVA